MSAERSSNYRRGDARGEGNTSPRLNRVVSGSAERPERESVHVHVRALPSPLIYDNAFVFLTTSLQFRSTVIIVIISSSVVILLSGAIGGDAERCASLSPAALCPLCRYRSSSAAVVVSQFSSPTIFRRQAASSFGSSSTC